MKGETNINPLNDLIRNLKKEISDALDPHILKKPLGKVHIRGEPKLEKSSDSR